MDTQTYRGVVEAGEGAAFRDYNVPTANLALNQPVILDPGVYAAMTTWRDTAYESVVCYGVGSPPKFEVHLFDVDVDMYGGTLEVEVFEKVSELIPWESKERMRQKILHDLDLVRGYFGSVTDR